MAIFSQQILLVEDDPHQAQTLSRRLKNAGYWVTVAHNYTTAKHFLETAHFHLAVIDICLDRSGGKNEDGLRLLADIQHLGLQQVLPTIIVTAYGSEERALKAWREYGAADYIVKEPYYISALLEKIKAIFDEQIRINFGLELLGNSEHQLEQCADHIHKADADTTWPASVRLTPEVYDVIGKMFAAAESVVLNHMNTGMSGSVVFHAHPTFKNGLAQRLIAKIGRRDKTLIEERNYRNHVKLYLPMNRATQLDMCYTQHLGGLLYTLNMPDVAKSQDLQTFYKHKSADQVVRVLTQLFQETCALWYENRSARKYASLRDLYSEAFNLQDQSDRIPREVSAVHPELDWQAQRIALADCPTDLPNPLLRWANTEAWLMPVSRCITHGDLNANNVLITEEGQCWLIDFYRTYSSHILRDYVVLETDIKFRLMEQLTSATFFEFEARLTQLAPDQPLTLPPHLPTAAQKAGQVIAGLRALAWPKLDWGQGKSSQVAQSEYLTSLLITTLNILRLRHYKENPELRARRELALISAGLICQQLEILEAG